MDEGDGGGVVRVVKNKEREEREERGG